MGGGEDGGRVSRGSGPPFFSFLFKVKKFASVKDGCYLCVTVCEIRTGSDTGIVIDCFPLFMAESKSMMIYMCKTWVR